MTRTFGDISQLRDIRAGEPVSARMTTAQNRALRQLLSFGGAGVVVSGGNVMIGSPPVSRNITKLIRLTGEDDDLGVPFYTWEEIRLVYDDDDATYLPEIIDGGATSETHGPAYVVGAAPLGPVWSTRIVALDGQAMWFVGGGPALIPGTITAVSGADGDTAGAVFYTAESNDGSVSSFVGAPFFRPYGDEVPVNVAEVGSACLIMLGADGVEIAFTTETFATETCEGELAFVFGDGPDNGLDFTLVLIADDDTVAVTEQGNVAVSVASTFAQSLAFDRIAVGVDGDLLVGLDGVVLVTYSASAFVHPDAFAAIAVAVDGTVALNSAGNQVAASPLTPVGVAATPERSTRSEVVRFEAFMDAKSPVPIITGSRGGNVALANLLTALDNLGIIGNSTTA